MSLDEWVIDIDAPSFHNEESPSFENDIQISLGDVNDASKFDHYRSDGHIFTFLYKTKLHLIELDSLLEHNESLIHETPFQPTTEPCEPNSKDEYVIESEIDSCPGISDDDSNIEL